MTAPLTTNWSFRLLVPLNGSASPSSKNIVVQGKQWTIKEFQMPTDDIPAYTCVSYAWGKEKTANPVYEGFQMSGRAMAVLDTATGALSLINGPDNETDAIWMDAFCVPPAGIDRHLNLQNMGAIYARARQVVVVFSTSGSNLLQLVREKDSITVDQLSSLEEDEWISRAWTYQEIANSQRFYFVAERDNKAPVEGADLLQPLSELLNAYERAEGYSSFAMQTVFPRLTSLEALMVESIISSYTEKSVYQVIATMYLRETEKPEDVYDAMIGAITDSPLERAGDLADSPVTYFLQVCEAKGDFSFIYSIAGRSKIKGRKWRPEDASLQLVLPWIFCFGKGQPGKRLPGSLQLDKVRVVPLGGQPDSSITDHLSSIFKKPDSSAAAPLTSIILESLRQVGFSGCGEYLELENGYFFPQETIKDFQSLHVVIASGVRFPFGATGLLVKDNGSGVYDFYDVGLFVGHPSKEEELTTILLA